MKKHPNIRCFLASFYFFSIVLEGIFQFLYVYTDYLSVETNGINGRRLRRGNLFEKLSMK